jgi:hypothetical protein
VKIKQVVYPIKVFYNRRTYGITVSESKVGLIFTDDTGARIGFIKGRNGEGSLSVFTNNVYKDRLKKYKTLKNVNAYTLSKEQMAIFNRWLNAV